MERVLETWRSDYQYALDVNVSGFRRLHSTRSTRVRSNQRGREWVHPASGSIVAHHWCDGGRSRATRDSGNSPGKRKHPANNLAKNWLTFDIVISRSRLMKPIRGQSPKFGQI